MNHWMVKVARRLVWSIVASTLGCHGSTQNTNAQSDASGSAQRASAAVTAAAAQEQVSAKRMSAGRDQSP